MNCKQYSDSDIADSFSSTPEQPISGFSSLSCVTEDELSNLKDFLKSPLHSPHYDVRLHAEVQRAHKVGEKYKSDLSRLYRKFDDLAKQNVQLKDELLTSHGRVRNLLDRNRNLCKGCCKNVQLELEFSSKVHLLEEDVAHWKEEAKTGEELARALKLELEELKADFSVKSNSVDGLKSKIVDLYMEIQNLSQENIKINNALAVLSNELESVRKSEWWFKEQLHQSRAEKSLISGEVSKLQLLLASKERDLELRNLNYQQLKRTYEELQLSALIELNKSKSYDLVKSSEQVTLKGYESTIGDLTEELTLIKTAMDEQQAAFQTLEEHNNSLKIQNETSQKFSDDKDAFINTLKVEKKNLQTNVDSLAEKLKENEYRLMQAVRCKSEMEAALAFALNEKNEVEEAIRKIRQDFLQLTSIHYKLKEELFEKNKRITDIDEELHEVKAINQRLQTENHKVKTADDCSGLIINVLEWVLHSLRDIETCTKPKRSVVSLIGATSNDRIVDVLGNVDELFGSVSEKLQRICLVNKQLRLKFIRLKELEEKCARLSQHIEEDSQALQALRSSEETHRHDANNNRQDSAKLAEQIKQLRVILKAKDLEMEEKQNNYEIRNHTLLRNVKELMKEKNVAEKRYAHLEELYSNTLAELNAQKLQNNEIQALREACDSYKSINGQMTAELLQLEKKIEAAKTCTKCIDYDLLQEHVSSLEQKVGSAEEYLQQKLVFIDNLQLELQQTTSSNSTLRKQNHILGEEVERLSDDLNEQKKDCLKFKVALERDRSDLEELQAKLLNTHEQFTAARQAQNQAQKQNSVLYQELQTLKAEISNLQTERDLHQSKCGKKQLRVQKFLCNLQSEFKLLQAERVSDRSDKQFLRRLCNDLKYTLQTCVNHNKVLKRRMRALSANLEGCDSLPDMIANLPSPTKYDDALVKQLLKRFNTSLPEKQLVGLETSLSLLKSEIKTLKTHVRK